MPNGLQNAIAFFLVSLALLGVGELIVQAIVN